MNSKAMESSSFILHYIHVLEKLVTSQYLLEKFNPEQGLKNFFLFSGTNCDYVGAIPVERYTRHISFHKAQTKRLNNDPIMIQRCNNCWARFLLLHIYFKPTNVGSLC